jgi:hypothetical protein
MLIMLLAQGWLIRPAGHAVFSPDHLADKEMPAEASASLIHHPTTIEDLFLDGISNYSKGLF